MYKLATKPFYATTFSVLSMISLMTSSSVLAASTTSHGDEIDRTALLAVKSQLIDEPGGVLSSWNISAHHCNWNGVTCGRKHDRVIALELYSSGLAGTISPFIGNLTFLKSIWLHNNSLTGEIPLEIAHLFRLQELGLRNNKLIGEIPSNLSCWKNLQLLDIGTNNLEGKLPSDLGKLPQLQVLVVNFNHFSGSIFDIIANITSLNIISVTQNSFTGTIPHSIASMQNLSVLYAGSNQLSGIVPRSIFNISSLQKIDLVGNNLQGEIPANIDLTLPRLARFNLGLNQFSGSIPMSISNITTLYHLALDGNNFRGRVTHDFRQLINLQWLDFSINNLEGDIKFINTLVNCSRLVHLGLSENMFSGTLPKSLANFSINLTFLAFGINPISGTIPVGITNLINLVYLWIHDCEITGNIPHNLGNLQYLELIDLSNNQLTGEIPKLLGNSSHLSKLNLQGNKLQGNIPSSLGNCQYLIYLDLSYNDLNGTLPSELFEGLSKFVALDLSQNHLEGLIPLDVSKQVNMVIFRASQNKLSGEIPDGLGDISTLQTLDLSSNNLSGQIPSSLSKLPLTYLNLSYNHFEGNVPTMGVFANVSAVAVIGNAGLCGGVPRLHLPPCSPRSERKGKRISHALKLTLLITIPIVVVLTMAMCIYLTYTRKNLKSNSPSSETRVEFLKVSYDMLLKATDGFSMENLLGRGGYGSVYKGILDDKTVAVKVLSLQHRGGSKSFVAECKALRNVRHRNLVRIITACSSIDFNGKDFKALVFEFMSNGSLDKWLYGNYVNLTLLQRLDIAIDVAHALHYLHNECDVSIVHCDLKPSNILLDADMVAHVGDFGLVKFLAQPQHQHQSSSAGLGGTYGYAAPEYGLGGRPSTDGDIYSYGILLLELMTRKTPTDGMFMEDFNLHTYAQQAVIHDQIAQILDPTLEEEKIDDKLDDQWAIKEIVEERLKCSESMVSVGVGCSNHSPQDRMKITDVISRLRTAREDLYNVAH